MPTQRQNDILKKPLRVFQVPYVGGGFGTHVGVFYSVFYGVLKMNNPLWRYEMELPQRNDFDNEEDYDYAMNLWAHDRLYGWEDDLRAMELEEEYERELMENEDYE